MIRLVTASEEEQGSKPENSCTVSVIITEVSLSVDVGVNCSEP